jgi:hypothetical protein
MAVNHKLTHVVKDRVVQNIQLNASELLINFVGGSTMKVKIVESNSPPLREGARIRQISEDQAKTCHRVRRRQYYRRNGGRSWLVSGCSR